MNSRDSYGRSVPAFGRGLLAAVVHGLGIPVLLGCAGCLWGGGSGSDLDGGTDHAVEAEPESPTPEATCPAGVAPRILFGPERFDRATARPEREMRSFAVDDPSGIFSVVIFNGNATGRIAGERQRISSAVVQLNGRTVVGPERFSMNVHYICVRLDGVLPGRNELSVELRSRPGSFLTLRVVRTLEPVPVETIDVSAVPPAACVARPIGSAIGPNGVLVPLDPAASIVPGVVLVRFSDEVVVRAGTVPANLAALGVTSVEGADPARGVFLLRFCEEADIVALAKAFAGMPHVDWASTSPRITPDEESRVEDQWHLMAIGAPAAWDIAAGGPSVVVAVVEHATTTADGFVLNHPDLAPRLWVNSDEFPGDANRDGCPGICDRDDDFDCRIDEDPEGDSKYKTDQYEAGDRFCPDPDALTCEGGRACPGSGVNSHWTVAGLRGVQPDDDDESGFGDDFHGADFFAWDGDPGVGRVLHASRVMGVVGAEQGNGVGVVGVCPQCTLMPVLIDSLSSLPAVLDYVRERGARVVNMSWGYYEAELREFGSLPGIERWVIPALRAAREAGLVLVGTAGNHSTGITPRFPAGFRDVVGVGSTKQRVGGGEEPDWVTNCGFPVELVAPGRDIRVLRDFPAPAGADDWTLGTGTSVAAPQVAAGAALLLSVDERDPTISLGPGRVVSVLKSEATDMSGEWRMWFDLPVGYDIMTGYGRLDLAASLRRVDSRLGPVSVMRTEIAGLWADQWILPAGAGPTPVEIVVGGERGDVVRHVLVQVAEGVHPDFTACPGTGCQVLVDRTDFGGGSLDVAVNSDQLAEGRHVLRLRATDGADNEYEDRVAIIVDDVRIERPTWRAALRMGDTVQVRGTGVAAAGGRIQVGIAPGLAPPDDSLVWMPSRSLPLADDLLGEILAGGAIVPAAGEYTIRARLQPAGSGARKVDDVVVHFTDALASGWPADLGGGFWSGNFVPVEVSLTPPRTAVAVVRQEAPTRNRTTARLVVVEHAGAVREISDVGLYPGPVCAADLDGDASDELVVLRQATGPMAVVVDAFEVGGGTPAGFTPASFTDETIGFQDPGEVRPNLVLADATGDGRGDIAVLTKDRNRREKGHLHLLDRTGREVLRPAEVALYDQGGLDAVVDIDGDLHAEFVVRSVMFLGPLSGWSSELQIYEQNSRAGSIVLRRTITVDPTVGAGVVAAAAGDLDGDELPEIVAVAMVPVPDSSPNLHTYAYDLQTGEQRWNAPLGAYGLGIAEFQMRVAVAVVNLDGGRRFEVIVSGGNTIHVLRPDGTAFPGWVPPPVSAGRFPYVYGATAVADVDGDGGLELVAERHLAEMAFAGGRGCPTLDQHVRANASDLLAWNLDGSPAWPLPLPAGGTGLSSVPVVADMEGDGQAELVDVVAATGEMQWRGEIAWAPAPGPGYWDIAYRFAGASVAVWDLGTAFDPRRVPWSGYRGNKSCNGVATTPAAESAWTVDLAVPAERDAIVYGADEYDTLGFGFPAQRSPSIVSGDLTGDGVDDLVVGVPGGDGRDESRSDAGELYVLPGGTSLRGEIDAAALRAGDVVVVYGARVHDGLGYALAIADINGDRRDDLLVGAPGTDGPVGSGVGAVYVLYGPLLPGSTIDLAVSVADVTIFGESQHDFLGTRLAAGDLNGDGTAEIVAEAAGADLTDGTRPCARAAFVIRGFPYSRGTVLDLSIDPWPILSRVYGPTSRGTGVVCGLGADFEKEQGMQPWSVGDVNGDRLDDLVVGSPDVFGTGHPWPQGGADVFLGSPLFPGVPDRLEIDLLTERGDITVVGAHIGDRLGFQTAVGDVDGDGLGDILLGAPGGDGPEPHHARQDAGEVAVIFGAAGSATRHISLATATADQAIRLYGPSATFGEGLGSAVAAADINRDGIDDLLMGAPGLPAGPRRDRPWAGVVMMKHGPLRGAPLDLRLSPPDLVVFGAEPHDGAGWALSDGDVNGDGLGDVVIHAPNGDGPPSEWRDRAGEIAVVFGR